ncbi:MAG: class II fructose-bisphosphate aldolase [Clostridia bacterium]
MALTNIKDLMQFAKNNHYAIPAFNVDNLESVMAVTEVIKQTKTPVIIQTIPRTLDYGGIATYPAMINSLMQNSKVDYAIHLDHGNSYELANSCLQNGFTSVMYDGSLLSFEDNIANTLKVVILGHSLGAPVEGELGTIGGKEQNTENSQVIYTKVSEAIEFVERTKVDALAIGVGTAHGIYKGTPKINTQRIKEINDAIPTLLVLHGASGLSDETIKDCIKCGITKINFATELRQAYTNGIRNALLNDKDVFDPKLYMPQAIENISKVIISKIKLCFPL